MADSPSVRCEKTTGAALFDRSANDSMEAEQLAALRSVLLGPLSQELERLRGRVVELERALADPDREAARIAGHLPRAFSLCRSTDPAIARALAPLIELALWERLRKDPVARGGGVGRALRTSFRQWVSAPACIARNLLFRGRGAGGEILVVRLVHRGSYTLMEEFTRPLDDSQELGSIVSMLAFLQEELRDETFQAGYEKLEALRVGNLSYGIHVGPLAILFSAIRGRHPAAALSRCKATLEAIHQTHAVALGDFDPAEGLCDLLPDDLCGVVGEDPTR